MVEAAVRGLDWAPAEWTNTGRHRLEHRGQIGVGPMPLPKSDRAALLRRAAAGRDAIKFHAGDPELILSIVVWPPLELVDLDALRRELERSGKLTRKLDAA